MFLEAPYSIHDEADATRVLQPVDGSDIETQQRPISTRVSRGYLHPNSEKYYTPDACFPRANVHAAIGLGLCLWYTLFLPRIQHGTAPNDTVRDSTAPCLSVQFRVKEPLGLWSEGRVRELIVCGYSASFGPILPGEQISGDKSPFPSSILNGDYMTVTGTRRWLGPKPGCIVIYCWHE